jgi:hypothetical protein
MAARLRISQELSNNPFRAIDSTFCKSPFNSRKINLSLFSFFAPADGEVVKLNACLQDSSVVTREIVTLKPL